MRQAFFILLTLVGFTSSAFADPSQLVQLGDTLVFEEAQLKSEKSITQVEWSQSLRSRKEPYLQLTAMREGDNPSLVMLFVHKALLPALGKDCNKGLCKVKVSKAFQYGQNKEQTLRFVVWHDKSNKPYQHRFLSTSTLTTFSDGAQQLAGAAKESGLPIPGLGAASSMGETLVKGLKSVIGDPLRDF